ncbi:MAG: oligosaccharide flippase family protein [Acidimicrobiia bacterium]|nr:oligosaccharide flippase family protein [Acidimicrobiia bacterium]
MGEPEVEPRPKSSPADPQFKHHVMRGSVHLLLRQGVGNVIRVVGVFAMIGLLGAQAYGAYVIPISIAVPSGLLLQLGIPTYLTRRADEPSKRAYDLVATHNGFIGLLLVLLAVVLLPVGFRAENDVVLAGSGVALALAIDLQGIASRVKMDRELRFGERGLVEVAADIVFYGVAIPLAVLDFGFAAPVIGQIAMSSTMAGGLLWRAGYRPGLNVDLRRWGRETRRGYPYAVYDASIHAFDSSLTIIAGVALGTAGSGVVGAAQRLANRTAVLRVAVDQVAMASLAKVQNDPERLRRAHSQGVVLHLLSTGVIIAGVAFAAPLFLPFIIDTADSQWGPALPVLGLLCLFQLISVSFDLHGNVLRVTEQPKRATLQRILQLAIAVGTAIPLTYLFDEIGLGLAAVASTASFLTLEGPVRQIFIPTYRRYLPWILALAPASLTAFMPSRAWLPMLFVPAAVLLAIPRYRHDLVDQGRQASHSILRR